MGLGPLFETEARIWVWIDLRPPILIMRCSLPYSLAGLLYVPAD